MVGRLGGLYHEDWSNAFSVTLRGVASLCAAQDFGIPRPFGVKQISCEQWGPQDATRHREDTALFSILCSRNLPWLAISAVCTTRTGQMHFRLLCVELQVCVLLKTFWNSAAVWCQADFMRTVHVPLLAVSFLSAHCRYFKSQNAACFTFPYWLSRLGNASAAALWWVACVLFQKPSACTWSRSTDGGRGGA